jgi:glycerol kinase
VNVLAIDQGTSSTTALVVAADGAILGQASVALAVDSGADGRVEFDPEALLESVVAAGRDALARARVPVAAVGIGNQGESVVCRSPDWRAAGPGISWQDRRAATVTAPLAAHGDRLTQITGLPLDPYFTGPKLAGATAGPGIAVPVDAWVVHRLTGEYVTDSATASRSLLLDLDSGEWSSEACGLFGIDADDLPTVMPNAAHFGETEAFGPKLPVTGLCVDQQAALFAERCLAPGETKCTYGTGAFVLAAAGNHARRSGSGLAACIAWRLGSRTDYCLDGQVYTAGAAVDWLSRIGVIRDAAELDTLCGTRPPAADEPLFVAALAGLGAPWWRPQARGSFSGLSLASGRGELARALVWGIAAQIAVLVNAMESDLAAPCTVLRVDGGLTRSSTLLQAQADLLQTAVEVYPSTEATALGIAGFARLGAGLARSPEDALAPWSPAAVVEPAIGPDQAAELRARFAAAAERLVQA